MSKHSSSSSICAAVSAAQLSSFSMSLPAFMVQSSYLLGSIVAVHIIVNPASLPLPPALPLPMQAMLTRPHLASRVQTAPAAMAAPSAGVLPEISTCAGPLLPPPHESTPTAILAAIQHLS